MKKTGFLLYPSVVFGALAMASCSSLLGVLKSDEPDSSVASSAAMEGGVGNSAAHFAQSGPQGSASGGSAMVGTANQDKKWPNKRTTREDFVDKSQEEGSLWASSGQTNYYFTKNRIRSAGDIIALTVEDELFRQVVGEIRQTFSVKEQNQEVAILQEEIKQKLLGQTATAGAPTAGTNKDTLVTSSAAPQRTPASTPPAAEVSAPVVAAAPPGAPPLTPSDAEKMAQKYGFADVDIFPLLEAKAGEKWMGEIVQRYPNGNYQIRATKRINYKRGESRNVTVMGIVKAAEINEETDLVASGKLYETQIDISR